MTLQHNGAARVRAILSAPRTDLTARIEAQKETAYRHAAEYYEEADELAANGDLRGAREACDRALAWSRLASRSHFPTLAEGN